MSARSKRRRQRRIANASAAFTAPLSSVTEKSELGLSLAPEYVDAVYNRKNAMCKSAFTVDGFVAGTWRVDRQKLVVEPFGPLPAKWRREVDAEGQRLLAWWLDREEG